MQTETR